MEKFLAYEVHIERENGQPISLEDWTNVVKVSEDIRMALTDPIAITNPNSGEQISNPHTQGVAELFNHNSQTWTSVFRLFEGRVSTRAA